MKNSNVFIISDNRKIAEEAASKILLSRKNDSVCILNYKSAFSALMMQKPEIIILHTESDAQCNFLSKIKNTPHFKATSLIMLADTSDKELLCKGFDIGADDFIDINADETIYSMRIMFAFKNRVCQEMSVKKTEMLSFAEIIDNNTGFYTVENTNKFFEKEYYNKLINATDTVFMIVSPDNQRGVKINDIGQILAQFLRQRDCGGYTKDGKIYLLLNQTDKKGARNIFDKLNNLLPFDCSVSAAAIEVNSCEKFSDAEKILNKCLSKTGKNSDSFIFADKNYNISPAFNKINPDFEETLRKEIKNKIDRVVTPAFFKMQSIYEPKLFNTEIKQIINDKESSFIIKNRDGLCNISIKYENAADISVVVTETFHQKSVCDTVKIPIEEFSDRKLENIIQTGAEKFRKKIYKRET